VCSPDPSLPLISHVSVKCPGRVAWNVTVNVRVSPGASIVPSGRLVTGLSPLAYAGGFDLVIVTTDWPAFRSRTLRVAADPMRTGPKYTADCDTTRRDGGAAPADTSLVDGARNAHFDKAAYTDWLKRLRAVCSECKIVLIFDEVFVGFRLAAGGAQEYFGVRADMVTYGKSLAGGLPIGVVCGRKELMRRFRDEAPGDICFARGTFNSHPYVMTAMDEFLSRLASPNFRSVYHGLDETWNGRARQLNEALAGANLPIRVANLSSIWTVQYTEPSRYNWMFQYYLRAEGLALSWVGSGRLIFSLNYTDADFAEVEKRFVAAAEKMKRDGWWWHDASLTNKGIRRKILKEMLASRFGRRHLPYPALEREGRSTIERSETRTGVG